MSLPATPRRIIAWPAVPLNRISPGSAPGPSTPARTPTRPPGPPSSRSTPPVRTPRPPPATTRGTSTAAAATRPAPPSRRPSPPSKPASAGLAFASGLAATTAVFGALLKPGDEVAASADLYGGTFRLLERVFKPWGLTARYTDDSSAAGFRAIVTPKTKLVWIETPTNPLLQVIDIAAVAEVARAAGAKLAVDNTFASPYLQQTARSWGPTSSSTARRSTSAATPTWSAGRRSARTSCWPRSSSTRTPPGGCRGRSTRTWCCGG